MPDRAVTPDTRRSLSMPAVGLYGNKVNGVIVVPAWAAGTPEFATLNHRFCVKQERDCSVFASDMLWRD